MAVELKWGLVNIAGMQVDALATPVIHDDDVGHQGNADGAQEDLQGLDTFGSSLNLAGFFHRATCFWANQVQFYTKNWNGTSSNGGPKKLSLCLNSLGF